jgi:hypothetical protein
MRSRGISLKGLLYFIFGIYAIIIFLGSYISRNIAGCTDKLLSDFKKTELASFYKTSFENALREEGIFGKLEWDIEKGDKGKCIIYSGVMNDNLNVKYYYKGDKFMIILDNRRVIGISEGSEYIIEEFFNNRVFLDN